MDVTSLGFRTDLALLVRAASEVRDCGDHLVASTPHIPTFWWGNFVLLGHAPSAEEAPYWVSVFERELPGIRHRAFGVDGTSLGREELAGFAALGYETEASAVMTAREVHEPPRPNHEATIRPLESEDDWEQQVELSLAGEEDERPGMRDFRVRKVAAERALTATDTGRWYGAFLGGRLAASMGLFSASDGLARFQNVKTHPDARGRGLAGTLVHRVGRFGLDELGAHTLVMVADPDYLAIRVYRSVGFENTESQLQASLKSSS